MIRDLLTALAVLGVIGVAYALGGMLVNWP